MHSSRASGDLRRTLRGALKLRLLVEDGRKAGHTFSQPDLIVAAIALHHDLIVVTRDTSDYKKARSGHQPVERSSYGMKHFSSPFG